MEITITNSEVNLTDDYIIHTLYFKHNDVERKIKLRCWDYRDDSQNHYIAIYNNNEEIYEYVGCVDRLWDECEDETECSEEDKDLAMKIVDAIWSENFSFEGEDNIHYQCSFELPIKLEI